MGRAGLETVNNWAREGQIVAESEAATLLKKNRPALEFKIDTKSLAAEKLSFGGAIT
jgi:hypothetical protein